MKKTALLLTLLALVVGLPPSQALGSQAGGARPSTLERAETAVPLNLSQDSGESRDPAIAADSLGNVHVVWRNDAPAGRDILYRRWSGSAWSPAETLSTTAAPLGAPSIVADKSGNVHVVWQDSAGLAYRRWSRLESGWAPTETVANQGTGLAITADSGGNIHVVWNGGGQGLRYRRWSAGSWSAVETLFADIEGAWEPSVTVDPAGNVHVAGWDNTTPFNRVLYSRTNGRIWSQVENISDNLLGSAWHPAAGSDAAGNVHVAWEDQTGAAPSPQILYRRWNRGAWSPAENLSQTSGLFTSPSLAVDASGQVHVAWADFAQGASRILHKSSLDGAWSPAEVLTQTNAGLPKVASDFAGNLHVVWKAKVANNDDVFYLRRDVQKPDSKIQLSAGWNLVSLPSPQSDPSPGVIFADATAVTGVHLFQDGTWTSASRGAAGWGGALKELVDSRAYWVYASADTVLHLKPKPPAAPSYLLSAGWNMIGSSSSGPVEGYLKSLQDNWISLYRYAPGKGWEVAKPGGLGFTQIETGKGYWLELNASGVLRNNYYVPTILSDNLADFPASASVATDASGNAYAVWNDKPSDGASEVLYRRWNGSTWSEAENLSQDSTSSEMPSVAVALNGTVHVVWNDDNQGDNQVLYRRWDGAAWSPPEKVSLGNRTYSPTVAVDSGGTVHVAWLNIDDIAFGTGRIVHRRKAGATWSPPGVLWSEATWSQAPGVPALTTDPAGNVYAVSVTADLSPSVSIAQWNGTSWSDVDLPITAARSLSPIGQNAGPRPQSGEPSTVSARAAIGKNGKVHVVWQGGAKLSDIWYSAWNGVDWSPAESLTNSFSGDNRGFANPAIGVDGFDSVHILWNRLQSWGGQGDVFYVRRDQPRM